MTYNVFSGTLNPTQSISQTRLLGDVFPVLPTISMSMQRAWKEVKLFSFVSTAITDEA